MYWVDRLVVLITCVAAFLPVLTLRGRAARVWAGLLAGVAGALSIHVAGLAYRDWGFLVYGLFDVLLRMFLVCLFLIGLASGVSRLAERRNGRPSPRWVTPATLAVLLVLAFLVVPLTLAWSAEAKQQAFYRKAHAMVAAARDSAEAQTKEQLANRVITTLSASSVDSEEDSIWVADDLVALWHPGAIKASAYFLENDMPETEPDNVRPVVRNEVAIAFGVWAEDESERLHAPRQGDQFLIKWGETVEPRLLDWYWQNGLFFYDDTAYVSSRGGWTSAAKPLFADGRFFPLTVFVERDGKTTPLLVLHAVDDGGRWWLVAARSVISQPLE
jgi:hypothetical protein